MGLFDGGIPKGVQMMLINLVKDAAPQVVEVIDQFHQTALDLKAQSDRIEAKLDILIRNSHGTGSGRNTDGTEIAGSDPWPDRGTLNGAGSKTGE